MDWLDDQRHVGPPVILPSRSATCACDGEDANNPEKPHWLACSGSANRRRQPILGQF